MRLINFIDINANRPSMEEMIKWTKEALDLKSQSILPPKTSLKPNDGEFFNFMPCIIEQLGVAGVKVVSRHISTLPSIKSAMMLFDLGSGECLAVMDADFITMARTGIMAALSAIYLGKKGFSKIAIMGLGNTARATVEALAYLHPAPMSISVLAHKKQEESFINRFSSKSNINFTICNSVEDLFREADVIFSCISYTDKILCDVDIYKPGALIIPVHTRGFQNCDDVFDLIVADDIPHISGFGKFNQMKRIVEIGDVIAGRSEGRRNDSDRILAYNIGIGLLDVYFGAKLLSLIHGAEIEFNPPPLKVLVVNKHWKMEHAKAYGQDAFIP